MSQRTLTQETGVRVPCELNHVVSVPKPNKSVTVSQCYVTYVTKFKLFVCLRRVPIHPIGGAENAYTCRFRSHWKSPYSIVSV